MGIFEDGIVFNHTINQAYYYFRSENRLAEITELLKEPVAPEEQFTYTQPTINTSKENFEAAVEKAKQYITAGDIFQVVLSKRFQFQYTGSLLTFYKSLRQINPSPYMFYYKSDKRQIVGASPEMLVRSGQSKNRNFPHCRHNTCHPRPNRKLPSRQGTPKRPKRMRRTRDAR